MHTIDTTDTSVDIRGTCQTLPDIASPEIQAHVRSLSDQFTAELWRQRLIPAPTMTEVVNAVKSLGLQHLPASGLTHYGPGPGGSEYFFDDRIVLKVTESHGHFSDAEDPFHAELKEEPPRNGWQKGLWRAGFSISVKGRTDESWVDFGTVPFYAIPASAGNAVRTLRPVVEPPESSALHL